ncbi:nonribosomal peptide [Moniliophthora roreri MCA 2997]|uniref:Nonribosomal peptide n=2 Tax=Moniliophthora roreri TaxID=221103 RepID=V2XBU3_MONRO|nr:nonribosomal peptide [Moniliophthora roreri MCA 2997]KAI3618715.1 nonribosomal peptide [Moniliophthora roreri]
MGSIDAFTSNLTPLPAGPDLLPNVIDFRSYHDASKVCVSYPQPGTANYIDITYSDFGHAVDKAAWEFHEKIGARRSSEEPTKTVGILARSDAGYMISIYALHKCGIVPLLISPRNSRAAVVNLLKLTGSVALITDSFNEAEALASAEEAGVTTVLPVAPLPVHAPADKRKSFPFTMKWEEECDKPVLIMHTSGSTGLPKPVAWNSRFVWHQGYYPPKFVAKYAGSSVLATLPLFHGSGVALTRASLLWLGWRVVFSDPSRPVNASSLYDFCQSPNATDIVIGAPSVIEEMGTIDGGLEVMRQRKFWFFVGAPVPPHFGDLLVKQRIHFLSMLGSTEIGQMNVLEPDGRAPEDWQYHQIRPDLNIVLEPRGSEPGAGPFELVILEKDGWKPGTINVNINGRDGYSTSDLYQKHASHSRLFRHCGRADDVVVLSNGEKTMSRPIETVLDADPLVGAAVVFGTGRAQNGVLISPSSEHVFDPSDDSALAAFRNAVWPSVEKANSKSPSHSQIWKEMLLITTPGKELPRTDKGSIQRKKAIALYADEIDAIYLAAESTASSNQMPLPTSLDSDSLVPFFSQIIQEAMGKPVAEHADLFANGMDSLKAIFVRNTLLAALKRDQRTNGLVAQVPQNFVFMFSSTRSMAGALGKLVEHGHIATGSTEDHVASINAMIEKYTQGLPKHTPSAQSPDIPGETVILTGSTGSLGSFILNNLLHDGRVVKVHCFNRAGSLLSPIRQDASFQERHLDRDALQSALSQGTLVFHDVEINKPNFGLPSHVFAEIHASATLIIHNAWALNFNWSLETFESVHIKGLRNVVDFALTSPRRVPPRVAFTSSVASTGQMSTGPVPEESIDDPTVCLVQGYAQSKFVGERILTLVSEKTNLISMSFRIGQICGDKAHSIWNATDNVPVLLKGCQELKAVPVDWVPVVAWAPVDNVAGTIVDVSLIPEGTSGTFHVTNPTPTPWADLVPSIQKNLVTVDGSLPELIKMDEWIQRLKDCDQSPEDNPAIKLVAFFENIIQGKGIRCRLATDKTRRLSPSLSKVPVVDGNIMAGFIDYWKKINFLRAN